MLDFIFRLSFCRIIQVKLIFHTPSARFDLLDCVGFIITRVGLSTLTVSLMALMWMRRNSRSRCF